MHPGLSIVLLALLAVSTLLVMAAAALTVRRIGETRASLRAFTVRMERETPGAGARLARMHARIEAANRRLLVIDGRMRAADSSIAAGIASLRGQRDSVRRVTTERLVPALQWLGRVVMLARLLRLRRAVFG